MIFKKIKFKKNKICKECGEKCNYNYKLIYNFNKIHYRCEICLLFELDNIENIPIIYQIKKKKEKINLECNNKNCKNKECKYLFYGLCENCKL